MASLQGVSGRKASTTFLQSVNAVGEYMLNKAIGEVDAGACVSEVHQRCGCAFRNCGSKKQVILFSCFGACSSPWAGHCGCT
jgi:hypothetical protein